MTRTYVLFAAMLGGCETLATWPVFSFADQYLTLRSSAQHSLVIFLPSAPSSISSGSDSSSPISNSPISPFQSPNFPTAHPASAT